MRDRLSTKILSNGAARYGVYDETGALLRYEYIKLEDEPSVEGDLFSKANILPDSIPRLLGLKMENPQVKDALNVLANVGNLHVWERVQTYAEPVPEVPAGYTLGAVETNKNIVINTYGSNAVWYQTASSVAVDGSGNVSLVSPSSAAYFYVKDLSGAQTLWAGKFVLITNLTNDNQYALPKGTIFFVPSDGNLKADSNNSIVYVTKYQSVTGYPYTPAIPAGTYVDYLTSTNRNAYPDKSAEGGEPEKPAHYTLGEAETVDVLSSAADYSAMVYVCDLNSIIINNDGSINTTNFSTLMGGSNSLTMAGNWTKFSTTKAYYITSNSSNVVFTDTIFTVSAETTLQYADGKYVLPGCRELIGHAKVEAIPPNTAITYLGQLGGGARIEAGSYVGTGTYGSSNPNSLTASFPIKIAIIGNYKSGSTDVSATAIFLPMGCNTKFNKHGYFFSDYDSAMQDQYKYSRISEDGKTLYWYDSRYAKDQLNVSTRIYFYVLIG